MPKPSDTVTLPRAEYEAMQQELEELREDLHDLRAIREARLTDRPEDAQPIELIRRMVDGEHPLRIWREHRGLTLHVLAERSGVPNSYISEIETRKKPGSVKALKALAEALEVDLNDLVP